ncbi:MAG TPA: rod shape-determining protein RodA [Leptolyngbyaceae cyanobacterium M65_K2018_010]|nr:rod shape-determining protein RodA [Leptolyngbyaceae cyanobacterium M65_K2018_010]
MLDLQWQKRWRLLAAGWPGVDWLLMALPVGLTVFGALVIHSTQLHHETAYGLNHLFLGLIGLGLALWIARSRYENLLNWQWIIYGIVNCLLVAVIFIGTVGLGAQRWIAIGPFNIQPSEFAKLGVIITLARLLSQRDASTLWGVLNAVVITALPWLLVFIQPDLGTSLVFGAIVLGMLYWANCNPGWLVLFISPVVAALLFHLLLPSWLVWSGLMGAIAWFTLPWRWFSTVLATAVNLVSGKIGDLFWGLLHDYQKDRLILFLDPDQDPLGGGYHLIQSRIAIGAGRLWGQGWGEGSQTQLNFIPEQHTDFIFSAIGEEWGFVGCLAVLAAYLIICFRLIIIAQNAKDDFGSLLVVGVFTMIVFQLAINIGMTIGLAPVTGIPLPWLSYGRSALMTNFVALGLVESVANFRHRLKFTD